MASHSPPTPLPLNPLDPLSTSHDDATPNDAPPAPFLDYINLFKSLESGFTTNPTVVAQALQSLSTKYGIPFHEAPDPGPVARPRTTATSSRKTRPPQPQPVNAMPVKSPTLTAPPPRPPRPATVSAFTSITESHYEDAIDDPSSALDLFETDASFILKPVHNSPDRDIQPTTPPSPTTHNTMDPPTGHHSPHSPLPPLPTPGNINDPAVSAFYSAAYDLPTSSLYSTLLARSLSTPNSTTRTATGRLNTTLSAVALGDNRVNKFDMYTHTAAEARVSRTATTRSRKTRVKVRGIQTKARGTNKTASRPATTAHPKASSRPAITMHSAFSPSATTPLYTSVLSPLTVPTRVGSPTSSPYHEHSLSMLQPLSSRVNFTRERMAGVRADIEGVGPVDDTSKAMRAIDSTLRSQLSRCVSRERTDFYKEVINVNSFRKELPLKFLAGVAMEKAKKRTAVTKAEKEKKKATAAAAATHETEAAYNNPANDDDDISITSDGSSVMIEMDEGEIDVMRLAVGKVVDGFMRLLMDYYSFTFKQLLQIRDASRAGQRVKCASQIQGWFRGFWAKRMVRRKRNAIKSTAVWQVDMANQGFQRHLYKIITAQKIVRGYTHRQRVLDFRNLILAASTIQRAWARKQIVSEGMGQVARYWFLQDVAITLQSAVRCYRARVIVQYLKRNDRHKKINRHYDTDGGVVRLNFEMNGAAARIQRWFKRLPYRMRRMVLRIRRNKARQIGRWYIYTKAKNSLVGKLFDFRTQIVEREKAALLLWPVVRGGVVRRRNARVIREAKKAAEKEIEIARKLQQESDGRDKVRAKRGNIAANKGYFSKFRNAVHLEELNPMTLLKHKHAAVVIQKHMRRCLALKIRAQKEHEERVRAVSRMQKKFKQYTFRKARWASASLLIRMWGKVKRKRAFRNRIFTKMQAKYRGLLARRQVLVWRLLWNPTATRIQKVVRGFLHRMSLENVAQNLYWQTEFKMNGSLEYKITCKIETQRQLFHHSVHFKSPHHQAELQCIFGHYCSMGQRGNTERLGGNMFLKLCKESNLLTKSLTQQKLELLFAHEKGKDTHLHYPQFLSALYAVVEIKYAKISSHGRYKDANARLLKALQEDILTTKTAKTYIKDLGQEKAEKRATRRASDSSEVIQRNWRAAKKREKRSGLFLSRERAMIEAKKLKALQVIQRTWRCALARYQMRLFALKVYQKIIDEHHGNQVYYFNIKTGTASWKKPILLGKFDIENPIKMPSNDRLYKKTCDFCGIVSATWYDIDDEENFCDEHNEAVHEKGRRSHNTCVQIDNCIQCEFQVATKLCVQCKDMYCDTCYYDQHKKGMLQKHYFDAVQTHCATCDNFVAMLSVSETNQSEPTPMCKVCYKKKFPFDKTFSQSNARVQVTQWVHEPPSVKDYWREIEEEKHRKELDEEFKRKKAANDILVRDKSALLLQKMWRGSKGRRHGAIIMAARRQARIQRDKDEVTRSAMWYIVRMFLGSAPELLSDTTMEKVLKRFPSRWADLIVDIVDGQWDDAFKMVSDQEKFVNMGDDASVGKKKKMKENMSILSYVMFVANQKRAANKAKRRMDKAQLKYRTARSNASASPDEKEKLKMEMRRTKNVSKREDKTLAEYVATLKEKREKIEHRKGPNQFKKKVKEGRREGNPVKWRKKDIVWNLKRFEDVVTPVDSNVDVFGKKLMKIGARLRLGDKERHGLLFYTVVDPMQKVTWADKMKDRINAKMNAEKQKTVVEERKKQQDEWNNKHVRLNRQWMPELTEGGGGLSGTNEEEAASSEYLHVMPRELFFAKRIIRVKEWSRNNMLSQLVIARAFKTTGRIANNCDDMAKKFDEDSSTAKNLKLRAERYRIKQKKWMLLSNTLVQESDDGNKAVMMNRLADSANDFLRTAKKEFKNVMASFKKKKKKEIDQFAKWDVSEEKVDINVSWQPEEGEPKKLGGLMMDVDAPASVAREYCRRLLRKELNSRSGENFMFMARGEGLPLADESYKRIGQLAPQKFNSQSREVEHTLLLIENKSEGLPKPNLIPVIKSEAEKSSEAAFEEKKLAAFDLDEKKKDIEMSEEMKLELTTALQLMGIKEKKAFTVFNRKGLLNPVVFNELSSKLPLDEREKLKRIVDKSMGVDSLAFLAEGAESAEQWAAKQKAEAERKKEEQQAENDELLDSEERVIVQAERAVKKKKREEEAEKAEEEARMLKAEKAEKEGEGSGEVGGEEVVGGGGEGGEAMGEYYTPWAEAYDEQGGRYYYNSETGVSQYEYPAEWQEQYDAAQVEGGEGRGSG